ncbi:MAG: hypothetical protein AAFR02_12525, partial [Pseudomonadota bacterium]
MALWHALRLAWWSQRGYLFPWVPVWLACGIGLYFGLKTEPQIFSYVIAVGLCLTCLFAIWLGGRAAAPVFWVLFLILLGALIAGARAHQLAEPVLGWRYYGPIEGRIAAMLWSDMRTRSGVRFCDVSRKTTRSNVSRSASDAERSMATIRPSI